MWRKTLNEAGAQKRLRIEEDHDPMENWDAELLDLVQSCRSGPEPVSYSTFCENICDAPYDSKVLNASYGLNGVPDYAGASLVSELLYSKIYNMYEETFGNRPKLSKVYAT